MKKLWRALISSMVLIFVALGFQSCGETATEKGLVSGLHLKDDRIEQWVFLGDSSLKVAIMFENNLLDSIEIPIKSSGHIRTKKMMYAIDKLEAVPAWENAELVYDDISSKFIPVNDLFKSELNGWDSELNFTKQLSDLLKLKAKDKLSVDRNEDALSLSSARVYLKQFLYRESEDASNAIRDNMRIYDEGNKGRAIRNIMKLGDL